MSRMLWLRFARLGFLAFAAVLVGVALLPGAGASAAPSGAASIHSASSATIAPGGVAHPQLLTSAPVISPQEQQQVAAATALANRPGPRGTMTAKRPPAPKDPPMAAPVAGRAAAPTDVTTLRDNVLPAGGQFSGVGEPSTDANGRFVFQTGNWYAARSADNGATWTYLNPFTIFGAGFCCDQVTVLDTSHNRQFWLLQYNDGHLVLANSPGNDLASWCFYGVTPGLFGLPATDVFDFNKIAVDANNVFFSTNVYATNGFAGALVARWPIDAMSTCAGFGFNFVFRSTDFSVTFVQGTGDTMYWGTNWPTNAALGSTFRVFSWVDSSGSFSSFDRSLDAYTFLFSNTGTCGSADAVVTNWCQFTDSRMTGSGYVAIPSTAQNNSAGSHNNDAIVGFAFNARQDAGHPFPFIRRVYFRASDMAYLGFSENWGTFGAFLYPDLAPNARGHVGEVWAWGGGTGTTHYFPGFGYSIDDDIAPNQPWTYVYQGFGAGNACVDPANSNFSRWGDYLTVRAWNPSRDVWIGSAYLLTANATQCGFTQPVAAHNFVFGRVRDAGSYNRWSGA
jgi:hypothetical protein